MERNTPIKYKNCNELDDDLIGILDNGDSPENNRVGNNTDGRNWQGRNYLQRVDRKWKYSTVLLAVLLVLIVVVFISVVVFIQKSKDKDITAYSSSSLQNKKVIEIPKKPLCSKTEYWTGIRCATRKELNGCCTASEECKESLLCINTTCACNATEVWTGIRCLQPKQINESCALSIECKESLECIGEICDCKEGYKRMEDQCLPNARECSDLSDETDGVYTIFPVSFDSPVQVYCIMEQTKKWTVIHRRSNGSLNFNRNWQEYKVGFGSAYGEYWLGNEKIHVITSNGRHEISFFLISTTGKQGYANYSSFSVGDEDSGYVLRISGYSGDIEDAINYKESKYAIDGHKFSTYDRDNDKSYSTHCGEKYSGGWWYNKCHAAHLNGDVDNHGRKWYPWGKTLKYSLMMVRRKDSK